MVRDASMTEGLRLRHRVSLLLVACAGTGLTLLAFGTLRMWEQDRIQSDLREAGEAHRFALQRALDRHVTVLESLAGLYASSEEVTREEFHTFAGVLLKRHTDIQALEWVPLVPDHERAACEDEARADGLTEFRITERTPQGETIPAARREEYFPIYFVEPVEGNESVLGFDLASAPARSESLNRARDAGETTASGRIELLQETSGQYGYLIFLPVYTRDTSAQSATSRHNSLRGFVLGVGCVRDMVDRALGGHEVVGVDIIISDASATEGERFLLRRTASGQTANAGPLTDEAALRTATHHAATLDLAAREWTVLSTPTPGFIASRRTLQPWIVLAAGPVFTGLLVVYILSVLGGAAQARRFASEQARSRRKIEHAFEEQKRAEAETTHLRNMLSNVVNSMPSVLIGVDPEGRVTQWNKGAADATGLAVEDAVGRTLADVFPSLAAEMAKVHEAIRSRQTQSDAKVAREIGGEVRFEDVTVYPLIANGIEGAVVRLDDVTERVRLEEIIIQSEKMLSVGGLAAGMAHEINNPLSGILQNAAVLSNRLTGDLPGNHQAAEDAGTTMEAIRVYMEQRGVPNMLRNLHDSGERAAQVVQNMLSFARKSESSPAPRDLAQLLDATIDLAQNDYDLKRNYDFRRIEIVREYDADAPTVPCEGTKLQQVFLNLLKNGAEAMSERVEREKAEGISPEGPRFILRVMRDGGFARIEVEDNGPGMDEETRRRVFEPFFTTKGVGMGTGLGLSVSYFIITENHGGTMDVESRPGEGCRFIIRLPLRRDG
jgi:PAS domain S-box-containing protein